MSAESNCRPGNLCKGEKGIDFFLNKWHCWDGLFQIKEVQKRFHCMEKERQTEDGQSEFIDESRVTDSRGGACIARIFIIFLTLIVIKTCGRIIAKKVVGLAVHTQNGDTHNRDGMRSGLDDKLAGQIQKLPSGISLFSPGKLEQETNPYAEKYRLLCSEHSYVSYTSKMPFLVLSVGYFNLLQPTKETLEERGKICGQIMEDGMKEEGLVLNKKDGFSSMIGGNAAYTVLLHFGKGEKKNFIGTRISLIQRKNKVWQVQILMDSSNKKNLRLQDRIFSSIAFQ